MAGFTQDINKVFTDHNSRAAVGTFHGPVYLGNQQNLSSVLSTLPTAADAPRNALRGQNDRPCLPDTRIDLLQDIYTWIDGTDERCIFWLSGWAGTGKSTVARTVSDTYSKEHTAEGQDSPRCVLGASFFFSKGGGDVGHAGKFVTSIAVQFANNIQSLKPIICHAISEHGDIAAQGLHEQWRRLVIGPLSKLGGSDSQKRYIIVIDALDECDDEVDIHTIIQLLAQARSLKSVQLRVFLTSRPEISIRNGFIQLQLDVLHRDFELQNIPSATVNHDIDVFLRHELKLIAQKRCLPNTWPGDIVIRRLVLDAGGLFIWAATACRFIEEGPYARNRLITLLRGSSHTAHNTPESRLDMIYTTVLSNAIHSHQSMGWTSEDILVYSTELKNVLESIVTLFSLLSVESLGMLLNTDHNVRETLMELHSILDIPPAPDAPDDPNNLNLPLRLHHPSFRDFLLDEKRCKGLDFRVDERKAHKVLASKCIQLMSKCFENKNCRMGRSSALSAICNENQPGKLASEVDSKQVERHLPPEMQYACLYWIRHLQKSEAWLNDNEEVHTFLLQHLLHWLEALAWMKNVPEAIHAIDLLGSITEAQKCLKLYEFVHDANRFVRYCHSAIEEAPFQIYCSALVFAPTASLVRMQFTDCIPNWIRKLPRVRNKWNALLQTLEGHSGLVLTVTFSSDGTLLASASNDKTIKIWDARLGTLLHTLEGHSDRVAAVAFSPDGKTLASASHDKTVKLWKVMLGAQPQTLEGHLEFTRATTFLPKDRTVELWKTGLVTLPQTLEGHSFWVRIVAFSACGKILASASEDSTVKLWDAMSGAIQQTFESHSGPFEAVAFSPEGMVLAVTSDRTIEIWDARLGTLLHTLEGHSKFIQGVAFSSDGSALASVSYDQTVKLWNFSSRSPIQTFIGGSIPIGRITLSSDGKHFALASSTKPITLQDTESQRTLRTIQDHEDYVCSIAFSPTNHILASGGSNTVKLWDTSLIPESPALSNCSSSIDFMTFSPDGKLLMTVSDEPALKAWDPNSETKPLHIQICPDNMYTPIYSPNGKIIALLSYGHIIHLWDASSYTLLQMLESDSPNMVTLVFSFNSELLAFPCREHTIRIWNINSNSAHVTLTGHQEHVKAIAFSCDNRLLVSGSKDGYIKVWLVESGTLLQTFEGNHNEIRDVVVSPDNRSVASASQDHTITLWNIGSISAIWTLEAHKSYIHAMAFSPDGKTLVSSSGDGTVKLWDAGSGALLHTFDGEPTIWDLCFSNDGTSLKTNVGSIPIPPHLTNGASTTQGRRLPTIFVKDQWVTHNSERIFWLPDQCRVNCLLVHENTVAFGYWSGKVAVMEFSF